MCGIVGVVGSTNAVYEVLEGLKRLEYRGYDSAGLATLEKGEVSLRRSVGKIAALENVLQQNPCTSASHLAIGHTRWATHGKATENNAHPHSTNQVAVVHNGIIENFQELKNELEAKGVTFNSQTDTETIPQLITWFMEKEGKTAFEAVQATTQKAEGAFAFGAVFKGDSNTIIASRRNAPLVVGLTEEDKTYLGSDPMALALYCQKFIFLEEDDIAILTPNSIQIFDATGQQVERDVQHIDVSAALTGKGEYKHFMQKEIHEQPSVLGDTIMSFLNDTQDDISLPAMPFNLAEVPQITIVACGTSYYAASVAKYWMEDLARTPVSIDIASEFRYRKPPLVEGGLCIFISQSGETADTLAALEYVKKNGQHVLSIVNVPNSSIHRASHASLITKAGPEIGVASTKAFTTQLITLLMLTLKIAKLKKTLPEADFKKELNEIRALPQSMSHILSLDGQLKELAQNFLQASSALYLGRGNLYPIAMEGALKLKEISYIHAEGYASGEIKHGPIALIDEETPTIALCPFDNLFEKSYSNVQEIEARRGPTLVMTDEKGYAKMGDAEGRSVIEVPASSTLLQPLLYSIPVQLLAYHVAVLKGTDVDQPRNLAKSVTVE